MDSSKGTTWWTKMLYMYICIYYIYIYVQIYVCVRFLSRNCPFAAIPCLVIDGSAQAQERVCSRFLDRVFCRKANRLHHPGPVKALNKWGAHPNTKFETHRLRAIQYETFASVEVQQKKNKHKCNPDMMRRVPGTGSDTYINKANRIKCAITLYFKLLLPRCLPMVSRQRTLRIWISYFAVRVALDTRACGRCICALRGLLHTCLGSCQCPTNSDLSVVGWIQIQMGPCGFMSPFGPHGLHSAPWAWDLRYERQTSTKTQPKNKWHVPYRKGELLTTRNKTVKTSWDKSDLTHGLRWSSPHHVRESDQVLCR
jgi:hypothetical protein